MIRVFFLLSFLLFARQLFAGGGPLTVKGRVVEAASGLPVQFATVALVEKGSGAAIAGVVTGADGSFEIKAVAGEFIVEISFIGLKKTRIHEFDIRAKTVDLGTVRLGENSKELEAVVVEGQKSTTEFRLDKRVFNVGADLGGKGASALDVLGNVPSVNVDIEGAVSLRGSSGVQILINGKPSVLTSGGDGNGLGSIVADMIESIEVITNPSAKYEAEGTSGIINIILKKDEKKGINGSVSVNSGAPHNHSVGFSINRRTEKFNLFSQLGTGYRELPRFTKSINENFETDTVLFSEGTEYRNEQFYHVILGADYFLDENSTVTLSGNYTLEIEDQPSGTDFTMSDARGNVAAQWKRTEETGASNPKYQFDLQYKRDFTDHKDHDLIISAIGSYFGKDQSSDFLNTSIFGAMRQAPEQKTATHFEEGKHTFKLDYARPVSDVFALEAGAQYLLNNVGNDFEVQNLISGTWTVDTGTANLFEYEQNVLGLYATGAYEKDKWGLKLGIRAENTELNTLLVRTNEANGQHFTNFFPSVHTSYKAMKKLSVQAGYSRRIYRPRLWDLNPFFNIRNNFSIRQGNPGLQPEFTDSYEVGTIYDGDKISMNFSVYYRYTTEVIERISFFRDNVSISKPINLGKTSATGIEYNAKYDPVKWFTANFDFNYRYFDRFGKLESTVVDFSADQWNSKLNLKFKLPSGFDLEVTGNYESGYRTAQGEISARPFLNLGARKKILNGKGVVYASARDLFVTRIFENSVEQQSFELYNRRYRGRFVTFGLSFGFGKGEAMVYTGGRRR